MAQPHISKISFGHAASPFGLGQACPSLSWRFEADKSTEGDWVQAAYEVGVSRNGGDERVTAVDSGDSVGVPWPKDEAGLSSRERVRVRVRARGKNGKWTDWAEETVEAALLKPSDWEASVVGPDTPPPASIAKRPFYLRKTFKLDTDPSKAPARLYATALGVYDVRINGKPISDHVLAPGWQSYAHRLHYQTYAVPAGELKKGDNTIEATVAEGWYAGRLTWLEATRNIWGAEPGLLAQLEVDGAVVVATDKSWEWAYGPLLSSELYDGETSDAAVSPGPWHGVKTIPLPPKTTLIAPEAPPVRRTGEVKPVKLTTTPTGKKIIDFGQNLVGWVKIRTLPKKNQPTDYVLLRFAEVMEKGELGVRPLRTAKATDRIYLSPEHEVHNWEPAFTVHGFRYCEISGPESLFDDYAANFVAVVVNSDMERIGGFECSHALINRLHENVVWALRGNFVSVPTDCPQRDERLGWTGDIQVFAPTANFLYDTGGFLGDWLQDLQAEQLKDNEGVPPLVVPDTLSFSGDGFALSQAVWGDVCILTPEALYEAYGTTDFLREAWESMSTWLDKGIPRGKNGLWLNPRGGFQLADWLDPRAPPDNAAAALTDQYLVADAYLVGVTGVAAKVAKVLGLDADAERYTAERKKLLDAFQEEYVSPSGRLSSDTQTAYALAYQFDLLHGKQWEGAAERLLRLVTRESFRIGTGFAGTPAILPALVSAGHSQVAYRMVQEKGCPSWLYPVTMGATTIWERWDSMLPDGSINPGEMTSFNHYALGAVAEFLHTTVAGLKPLAPGYRRFAIEPVPGGTLTSASAHTVTPYGRAAVAWTLKDGSLEVQFEVPPSTTAVVRLGGKEEEVGSGKHTRTVKHKAEPWPPEQYRPPMAPPADDSTLAE